MPKFKESPSGYKMKGWSGYQSSPIKATSEEEVVGEGDDSTVSAADPRGSETYSGYVRGKTKRGGRVRSRSWYEKRYGKSGEAGYTGGSLSQIARAGGSARPWWEEEEDLSGSGRRTAMTKKKKYKIARVKPAKLKKKTRDTP